MIFAREVPAWDGPAPFDPFYEDERSRMNKVCSIEGCGKPYCARGWCRAHYQRWWSYGEPLGGGTFQGTPLAFLENTVLSFDGDECLPWPYTKDSKGYGRIKRGGKIRLVHRIVCEHEHGPPPTSKHEAAHLCGKGHLACCNRKHLEWKTPTENQADRLAHGTHNRGGRNGRAKLTEAQVLQIRSSTKLQRELAAEYGVSPVAISDIKRRKKWEHIQ